MALQQCRLGALTDILQWDDADYDCAIETDQPIKAGTPVDNTDVLRLEDLVSLEVVLGPGASTDHAVVRWDGVTGRLVQDSSVTIDDSGNMTIGGELIVAENANTIIEVQVFS